jgi:hypothetical protein
MIEHRHRFTMLSSPPTCEICGEKASIGLNSAAQTIHYYENEIHSLKNALSGQLVEHMETAAQLKEAEAEIALLTEALLRIEGIVKPTITMNGNRWGNSGSVSGGNQERIWNICRDALGEDREQAAFDWGYENSPGPLPYPEEDVKEAINAYRQELLKELKLFRKSIQNSEEQRRLITGTDSTYWLGYDAGLERAIFEIQGDWE